jgi:hypothetical protein
MLRLLTEVEQTLEKRPDILSRANFLKNYRAELREAAERHYGEKLVNLDLADFSQQFES